MDSPELPVNFLEAAREYDRSLRSLGLRPDMLVWGWDFEAKAFQLVLVWAGVDRFGPLAVTNLLFKAYNASALPKAIDPFSVVAVGKSHPVASTIGGLRTSEAVQIGTSKSEPGNQVEPDIHFEKKWIITMASKQRTSLEVSKDWRRFNEKVTALAA